MDQNQLFKLHQQDHKNQNNNNKKIQLIDALGGIDSVLTMMLGPRTPGQLPADILEKIHSVITNDVYDDDVYIDHIPHNLSIQNDVYPPASINMDEKERDLIKQNKKKAEEEKRKQERIENEKKERERKEREQREKEKKERERQQREKINAEKKEKERKEREERERKEREEIEKREKDKKEREERERQQREKMNAKNMAKKEKERKERQERERKERERRQRERQKQKEKAEYEYNQKIQSKKAKQKALQSIATNGNITNMKCVERIQCREIITIHVGQCGNQIGNVFWSSICDEHDINRGNGKFFGNKYDMNDQQKLSKIDVYFQEAGTMRFVPRCVMVDLEPGIFDIIKASPMGKLFKPDNMCFGASGAGNNWAKGHYTEGAELVDEVMDIIRREVESCSCPQGFTLTNSLGGGTGSGFGTNILVKIRDNYMDLLTSTFSVFPSPKVSDVVVEPYNAILSIHQLLEVSDLTFVIDNEALFNISHNVLKQKEPKYSDLNWVITLVMAGTTASLRFNGKLNGDLRKLGVNLVPFPRLHFFLEGYSPLFAPGRGRKVRLTVQELTDQMWSSRNWLANIKSDDGKYLTASCSYRGSINTQEVDDEITKIQQKLADDFVTWIPNNIKSSIIAVPPDKTTLSGTFVANTTSIKGVFQKLSAQFAKMYKRKAFLHWYKGEGMDEMEFQEADKNVRDLVTEYQDKQDAVVDLDDDNDSNDDDDDDDYDDNDDDDDDADDDDDTDDSLFS